MANTPSSSKSKNGAGEELTSAHFDTIREQLYETAGITIADHKINMVHNRIAKRAKEVGVENFDAYIDYLFKNKTDEISNLVNALTTNVTHFFREEHHFDHLKKEVLTMIKSGQNKIRIWSAGCSIGAEPYSAALTMRNMLLENKDIRADIKILATDIDTIALARGRKGEYAEKLVKGISNKDLNTHFDKITNAGESAYKVKAPVRKMISFNYLNLNDDPWPMRGPFDVIFCRNVFIYFGREKQNEYVGKMTNLLRMGGYLCLGHSEHFASNNEAYETVGQTTYKRVR